MSSSEKNPPAIAAGSLRPGLVVGLLTIQGRLPKQDGQHIFKWRCKCACGESKDVYQNNLTRGATRSCGCGSKNALLQSRGARARRYPWDGKSRTLRQWAQEAGLPLRRVQARLKRGWPFEQALGFALPPPKASGCVPRDFLEFQGRRQSVTAWASERGMPRTSLRSRLRRGWTPGEALGVVPRRRQANPGPLLEFQGRLKPLSAWAQEFGVASSKLKRRLGDGWPAGQALGLEPRPSSSRRARGLPKRRPRFLCWQGKTLHLSCWSREVGLSVATLDGRMRAGWPTGEVLGFEPHAHGGRLDSRQGRLRQASRDQAYLP